MKKYAYIFLIAVAPITLFYRSFNNFFYQDDFFNMSLANLGGPWSAFDLLSKPQAGFYFYRPLTTQLFWWLGQRAFGLNPLGYHLLVFAFFLLNIFLVYALAKKLLESQKTVFFTTFFYAVSASHFYRLFFLSQFQEILLTTLVLLTVIFYLRGSILTVFTFILALMAKETAIVTPIILLSYELLFLQRRWKLLISLFAVLIIYFLARKLFFGFATGEAYEFSFAPKTIFNNYLWYALWSLGLPEAYVNLKIFTFPTIFNPKFLTEFGVWGNRTLLALIPFLALIWLGIRRWWPGRLLETRLVFFALGFFSISLLPVAFFPFHKFAYSVTLPLFGLALVLAIIISALDKTKIWLAIGLYLVISYCATQFNLSNHWAKKRAATTANVWQYLRSNYPDPKTLTDIYFVDETVLYCWPPLSKFRQSEEVAYALGGEDGLKLLYRDPKVKIYFADWDNFEHLSRFSLVLDSRQFLP